MMENKKDKQVDTFYEMMQELYGKGPLDEKHASPTKRLISLKNSTFDHKMAMQSNIKR